MGRVAITIIRLVIGLLAVAAYFSAVADDPCNDGHSSAPAVALSEEGSRLAPLRDGRA